MAQDADRTLREQLGQIERELEDLGDRHAQGLEAERAEIRSRILEQRGWHRGRSDELEQVRRALTARLDALGTP